jgi:4'-phosphopantetheinyl transferase
MCRTYIFRDFEAISEEELRKWYKLLPESRFHKAMQYKFFRDRRTSVLAFLLLRIAFSETTGIVDIPELRTNAYGKPYFLPDTDIFSLSHSSGAVMCSYGSRCGCDIQENEPAIKTAAEMIMTPQEVSAASDDVTEFMRIWTFKEAYGKYLGKGLNHSAEEVSFAGFVGRNGINRMDDLYMYSCADNEIAYCVISDKTPEIIILDRNDFCKRCSRLKGVI